MHLFRCLIFKSSIRPDSMQTTWEFPEEDGSARVSDAQAALLSLELLGQCPVMPAGLSWPSPTGAWVEHVTFKHRFFFFQIRNKASKQCFSFLRIHVIPKWDWKCPFVGYFLESCIIWYNLPFFLMLKQMLVTSKRKFQAELPCFQLVQNKGWWG